MRSLSLITAVLLTPVLSYAMSFNALCDHAYKASGEIIQTKGRLVSNTYEKASTLAREPLVLEGLASGIKGKDSVDSGIMYGTMLHYQLKKPALQEAQAHQYDQNTKTLQQEVELQQRLIQVSLKHYWLMALIEQERIGILNEKVASAKEGTSIGGKKVTAGRMSQMELLRLQGDERNALQELAIGKMEYEHAQHILKEAAMLDEEIVIDDLKFSFITDDNGTENRVKNAGVLQTLNAQINTLNAQIKSAHYIGNEFLSMGAGATHEPSQNSIDFRLSVPLAWGDKNEKKIAALMAEKSALIHRLDVTHTKLEMNIGTLLEHLHTREERFNDALITQKQQKMLMEMAQKGYDGGVVSQFEYLATKNSYYDARLRAIELKREYIQEMSAMEEKLGRIWE